jgi:hypothetical protein
MISITERPPLELPLESCPAFPYPEYRPIREETDVSIALEDQTQKLGSSFDRSRLNSFFRFVWLLNTHRHKSLQAYLFTPSRMEGFGSDVLVGPFDGIENIVTDLDSVKELSSKLAQGFRAASSSDHSTAGGVCLTPVSTKFGMKPDPLQLGFSLRLRVVSYNVAQSEAVEHWQAIMFLLTPALI